MWLFADDPRVRLLTGTEAAALAGVAPATIRTWHHLGRLTPVARQGRAWLYLESDVLTVEAETRRLGRRRHADQHRGDN